MAGEWSRFRTTATEQTSEQPRYKAGDLYEHDGNTYKLDERAATGLNSGASLTQDHYAALEKVEGTPDTASQILANNDSERAKAQEQNTRSNLNAESNAQQQFDNARNAEEARQATQDPSANAAVQNRQNNANSWEDTYRSLTPEQLKDPNNYKVLINASKADELTPEQLNKAIEDYQSGKYVPGAAGKAWLDREIAKRSAKSINGNPQVENALRESGVNVDAEAAPNINDVNKVEGYMKSSIGYNPLNEDPRKAVKDANELGTWDYIAIGLTALSAVMFAATGGEMQPIDFTKIGGTNQRIAALTEVRKQRDEFRSRLANEQSVREAFEAMPPEERALYNNDLEEYRKEIGRTYYETSEKFAQDESDMQTAITLKDIEHKYNKEIIGLNGQWDLTKLKANTEAQKDIARLLQSNKEGEAANIINKLKSAGCSKEEAIQMFGMKGDWQRYWDNAMGAVGTVGTTVANVAGALTSSDKNKKLTKHSYIPINKRG